jgi:hypothetical protein
VDELEIFMLIGVLTQNSNIVKLVKFLKINQRLHIQIGMVKRHLTNYGHYAQFMTNNTELAIYALEQVHCWGTYFRARTGQFENFTHLNF